MQNVPTINYVKRICAKSHVWYEMTVAITQSVPLKNINIFAIVNRGTLVIQSKDVLKSIGVRRILAATAQNVKTREIVHNVVVLRELLETHMKKDVERRKSVDLTETALPSLGVLLLMVLENALVSFNLSTAHIETV